MLFRVAEWIENDYGDMPVMKALSTNKGVRARMKLEACNGRVVCPMGDEVDGKDWMKVVKYCEKET